MSYPMQGQPPSPPERTRPATVTAATWLLVLAGALYIIGALAVISQTGAYTDAYEQAYAGTDMEGSEVASAAGTVGYAVIKLLFGVGFIVLAMLDQRGKNPARIVTWVVGGIALCCTGAELALSGIMNSVQMETEDAAQAEGLEQALSEHLPGWLDAVTWITSIGGILALIAALILLALPPSNAFFRKQPPQVEPPSYPQAT